MSDKITARFTLLVHFVVEKFSVVIKLIIYNMEIVYMYIS